MDYQWIVLILCSLSLFSLSSQNGAYPPILPLIMDDLNFTYTESGMITSAFFIGYTIGQIPWGYVADRYKKGRVIAASVLGLSLTTLLFSYSTSFLEILTLRFAGGILGAGIFVPSVKSLSDWFPSHKRGVAIGLFGVGSGLGPIAAAFVSPQLAYLAGWRRSLLFFSLNGLFIVPLILFWIKEARSTVAHVEANGSSEVRSLLKNRSFWILGYDQFLRLGIQYALSAWLPTYLYEEFGVGIEVSALSLVAMNTIGLISNPMGGIASDKFGEIPVIVLSMGTVIPLIYFLTLKFEVWITFIIIALLGWIINFMRGPIFAVLPKIFGLKTAGRSAGYQNTLASAGAFTLPFIVGYLKDLTGSFVHGWISITILTGLGSVGTLILQMKTASDMDENPLPDPQN